MERNDESRQLRPPPWIDDGAVDYCEACHIEFDFFNRRHHCRVCGHIFCAACTSNRMLLPEQFDTLSPERVCDGCAARVGPLQTRLQASRTKSALPNELRQGDYTGSQRRYLNQPIKFDLAAEIRKACWSIRNQIDGIQAELHDASVNETMLLNAVALCFITTLQGGVIVTGTVGTGLIVKKRLDGSWSAPCAVGTIGIGVGASMGLQSTDCIVTISEESSLETFLSSGQFCVGAEVGLSVGLYGRAAKADIRSNERATATTASYSQSKGLYGGVGLDSSVLSIRHDVNRDFYGKEATAQEILEHMNPPRAAAPLYKELAQLYSSFGLAIPTGSIVRGSIGRGSLGGEPWTPRSPGDDFGGSCEFATPSYHGPRNGASSFLRMDTSVPSESSSLSSEPSQASKNTKPPPSSINEADIERDTEAEAPGKSASSGSQVFIDPQSTLPSFSKNGESEFDEPPPGTAPGEVSV